MCQVGWKASDKGRLVPAVWNTQAKPRPQMLADSRQPPLILWGCHLDVTMAVNTQRNAASFLVDVFRSVEEVTIHAATW